MGILKEKRLAAVLSQGELSDLAGVDRRTIILLEREPPSIRPHPKTLRKLATALGVEPAELAGLLR